MLTTIARLFGKSPFAPLKTHMDNVSKCMTKLKEAIESLPHKKHDAIEKIVSDLSELEHIADQTKNDIRNHLPKSLFLPMEHSHFLEILSIQDAIADKAEEIGILLTLRPYKHIPALYESLLELFNKNMVVYEKSHQIINEIEELLESSFGGLEAEKVKAMVEDTAFKEFEANLSYRKLLKLMMQEASELSTPEFYLWMKLVEEVPKLAALSEKLANRIRMILELK